MSPILLGIAAVLAYKYYKSRTGQTVGSSADTISGIKKFISDPALVSVVLNSAVMVCGIFYLVTLNAQSRFFCLLLSLSNSAYIIAINYLLVDDPKQPSKSLKEKFASCMTGAEFPFLFLPLMFMSAYATESFGGSVFPFAVGDYLVALILVRRAVWFVGNHGSKNWTSTKAWNTVGAPLWQRLKLNEASILHLSVLAEIFIGFWLILLLITPARQLINTFVYWNYLRMKYLAPRSKPGHSTAWLAIDRATMSIRSKVPFAEKPIEYVKNWFNKV